MPAVTYEPIQTYTLTSATTTITFSSIPSTYTNLKMILTPINGTGSSSDWGVRYNSDGGANYSAGMIYCNGTNPAGWWNGYGGTYGYLDWNSWASSAGFTQTIVEILQYKNTNVYKNAIVHGYSFENGVDVGGHIWASTSAINRIDFTYLGSGYTFGVGTTVTLFGIKGE